MGVPAYETEPELDQLEEVGLAPPPDAAVLALGAREARGCELDALVLYEAIVDADLLDRGVASSGLTGVAGD